jgi:hypothetical protein
MNRWLLSIAIPVIVAFTAPGARADSGWKVYENARFGFRFSHPAALIAGPEPTNGSGREFHTRDKEFTITAWGQFMVDDTPEKCWENELADLGAFANYKRKAADWYVISGVKDGVEFYDKAFFKDGNGVFLEIVYPHAKSKQYDPWVEKIEKSVVPFLKGDFDRVVK